MPLSQQTKERIQAVCLTLPDDLQKAPASLDEVQAFEARFGSIPDDWRWFLLSCGGGVIGTEWVDTIQELAHSHEKFQKECGPQGWKMQNVFIIGWDGAGNPFGIDQSSGCIVVEDHTFGGVHELATSVEAFLSTIVE